MPHSTRTGRRRRAAPSALAAALVWLAVLAASAGPAAATDPTPTPGVIPTPSPTAAPTPTASIPAPGVPSLVPATGPTVTFYGRGYGHGVGLSQYGALGRAVAGELAPDILAHYFTNTTISAIDPATPVRVLVVSGIRPTALKPARIVAHGGAWTVDGVAGMWPAEASATFVRVVGPTAAWRLDIASPAGAPLASTAVGSSVRIRPAEPATRLEAWFKPSYYDTYRGTIRLVGTTSGTVAAINETTIETYLLGVVPCEMPSTWPLEALKAQAIAARSYAAAHLHPATGSWDVYDNTRSQVYRGALVESPAASAAIGATAGQTLVSGPTIVMALFHSSDGGATENNENVYVSAAGARVTAPLSYLRGSPDRGPDGVSFDAASPHAQWQTATYTYAQLSAIFAADPRTNVGALNGIDLSNRGVSGRLISVTVSGSLGSRTVSGEIFRAIFNKYSPATDPYMWSTLVATSPIP
jgi:stage II sporulation protein D